MNIREAINGFDNLKPNLYSYDDKIKWLNTLEAMIYKEIILKHEGYEKVVFEGYTQDTPTATELIAPAPYDRVYTAYIEAQVDYYNQEFDRYANSMQVFNYAYRDFANYWNRTHKTLSRQCLKYM